MSKTLIVHIGAGKTGTSSIQAALTENEQILAKHKIRYLGMVLENGQKTYSWQYPEGSVDLFDLDALRQQNEVFNVLSSELTADDGANVLVWSNEWMFGRHDSFIPALTAIKGLGYTVKIICYVREHGSWSRSAYEQWGINNKAYSGRVKSYREYFKVRPIRFMADVSPWLVSFGPDVGLRNFDCRDDIVGDFFSVLGINHACPKPRANKRLKPEELLARAIFNNASTSPTPPKLLRCFRPQNLHPVISSESLMNSLLPTAEDIEWVRNDSAEDLKGLNRILESCGEPPLQYDDISDSGFVIDQDALNMLLLKLLACQERRILELDNKLAAAVKACESDERN
ncbi:MAG: hypothetical protein KFB97_11755 [Cyanobium sp. M30B3]|nr:MAG: hypothetical protein KFB97_11755 [Cyanobium sp. M30B3]